MKKVDLKSDPKFLERVSRLNGKVHCKILKDPPTFTLKHGHEAIVAAIGLNGSYLVVVPLDGLVAFDVFWTMKTSVAYHTNDVAKWMAAWIIECTDSDYTHVPHRDVNIVDIAIKVIAKKKGEAFFGDTIMYYKQGVEQEPVPNPYINKQ